MQRALILITVALVILNATAGSKRKHLWNKRKGKICKKHNPCQNGVTCGKVCKGYICKCPVGWKGKNCDMDIDECSGTDLCNTCSTCVNTPGSYRCVREEDCSLGSRGNEFIVLFMKNQEGSTLSVYITSEYGVHINITTSSRLETSLKAEIDRQDIIPSSQRIMFPKELQLISFQKEVKSMLIETSNAVFINSFIKKPGSTGATTIIPLNKLSTKYVVISTEPFISFFKSQFAVAAIEDNTDVSVTFKMKQTISLEIEGNTYNNGDVFNIRLGRFETYQIAHITDLTGTFIESSAPIAAFSGNDCNRLEGIGGCDHLINQLPPIDRVDKIYIVPPQSINRDTVIRVTATENANIKYVIGGVTQTQSLNKFDSFDTRISDSQTCFIESDTPILVTAFGLKSMSSFLGDPSMAIVPGFNQYLDYYKLVVPSGFDHNHVSIMIQISSKDSLLINGMIVNTGDVDFEENVPAGDVVYNVRSIRVAEGELNVSTANGERFGLMLSGINSDSAYGISGNSVLP